MVGRRPNEPELALIALTKRLGFVQGKTKMTGVRWHGRSLRRADLDGVTWDAFYMNTVFGPFKNPLGAKRPRMFEMDQAWPLSKWNLELDGYVYHVGEGQVRDEERDAVLRFNGWRVTRITVDALYRVFVPLMNKLVPPEPQRRKVKASVIETILRAGDNTEPFYTFSGWLGAVKGIDRIVPSDPRIEIYGREKLQAEYAEYCDRLARKRSSA